MKNLIISIIVYISIISPFFVPRILVNLAAGQISMKYGIMGPNDCCTTACATGVHSICDGYRIIKNDEADIMICGSTESVICPLSISGFCRSKSITIHSNDNPTEASCPFDKKRNGFVMGEGCGVLILEELSHALKRNAKIYCEITGIGLSSDAYHITAPRKDGKGIILSMKKAMDMANLTVDDIDYINAHATSTKLGDLSELQAIDKLFINKKEKVNVSSFKGNIGHLLGGAGSVESILSILSLYNVFNIYLEYNSIYIKFKRM